MARGTDTWVAVGVAGVTGAVAVATVAGADWVRHAADPGTDLERRVPLLLPLLGVLLVAAVGACCVMAAVKPRPAVSVGVALSTALLGWWAGWAWLPSEVRAAVPALSVLGAPALAAAVLRWRAEPPAQSGRWTWALSAASASGAALLHAAAYDPHRHLDCLRTCRDAATLAEVAGVEDGGRVLSGAVVLAVLAVGCAIATVVGPGTRSVPLTLRASVALSLTTLGLTWILGGRATMGDQQVPLDVVVAAATMVVAVAGGAAALRVHVLRRSADVLIRELHRGRAGAIGDDSLAYDELSPAQRFAITNAQLDEQARSSLAETQAAQRQVIRLADDERERIERDLHDGAQQQLVTAALHLSVASGQAAENTTPALAQARDHVREALAELRRLSHGTFPAVLADAGLVAALEELVADHGGRLEVLGDVDERGDSGAARTAYVVIDDVLRGLPPGADVSVGREPEALYLVVASAAPSRPMLSTAAQDRLGASSGTFVVTTDVPRPGGTRVEVRVPCEW